MLHKFYTAFKNVVTTICDLSHSQLPVLFLLTDTTLMAESEEKLKSLLIKVKKESEKIDLKLKFRKLRSWHPVPSLHGK